ncbi:MAG: GNAT family N-acetyltransferase, partial [Thermoplasmata archaeon]|nr:GNAT family N-acetyltransferase [Thermoplasmata archaeon]
AELAEFDWHGFQHTPDASLVADSPEEDARVLREILEGRLGRYLNEASTALVDGEGRLAAFLLTSEQNPRRAVYLDLVVRPEARRQGVARYLLKWGARSLAGLGHSAVRLWVSEANSAARTLYDSIGFRPVGRAVIYRFGGDSGASQAHRSL